MSLVRPDLLAAITRQREVIAAGVAGALGLWLIWLGGYVLIPLGGIVAVAAAGWATIALGRLRFRRPVAAPGIVEVDEGQVGYLGPAFGGYMALADLEELRIGTFGGQRQWRLRTSDGQVLLIPVAAEGAERLADAFAVLPGIDMAALGRAIDDATASGPLWSRR